MPNWCKGNIRLRGKPEAIIEFLKNEFVFTGHKPLTFDVLEFAPAISCDYGEVTLKRPKEADDLIFTSLYIKGTRRNFIVEDKCLTVYVDVEQEIFIVCIDDFEAAWAIIPDPYIEKSKKYGLDIKIIGFECGMQFMQTVEIVNGKLLNDHETKFDNWGWDCPMPNWGG